MRFLMVTTFYPPYYFGGDATYVRALSRALAARGHAVEVVHCLDAYRIHGRGEAGPIEGGDGVTVHRLRSRFGRLSPLITQQTGHPGPKLKALRDLFARPFDVVHFHNISLIGGPAVLSLSRAPVTLYSLHEHWLLCPTHIFWRNRREPCTKTTCLSCSLRSGIPPQLWRYTSLTRRAVASVDALLAPSAFTARLHAAAGLSRPIHVLPLFSALPPGRPDPPSARRPTFLFVGRVTRSKGIGDLVEAFVRLPDYDLEVVGDGDARPDLEQRCRHTPNIRFLGALPQARLATIYRRATALIMPSLAPETFGLAVVEAFACGTPAIVRDAGGLRETVDATGAGFVYQDEQGLRAAVHRLAREPGLRERLGARAQAGYLRHYSEERHLHRYLDHVAAIRSGKVSPLAAAG